MNSSAEALAFTDTVLSTDRFQRHLGARIIISNQEPTISATLLNLCSIIIVYRFTSLEWFRSLQQHLAAAAIDMLFQGTKSTSGRAPRGNDGNDLDQNTATSIFDDIVRMKVGEALLFAPNAIVGAEILHTGKASVDRLGAAYLRVKGQERLTAGGGESVIAS